MPGLQIVVDTREKTPFQFVGYDCTATRGTLRTGDYSLAGYEEKVAVERKSLPDLVLSLTTGRSRFVRELERSRELDSFAVIIEADVNAVRHHLYRSKAAPHSILQSVISLGMRFKVPFIWAGSREGAEYMAFWNLEKWLKEKQSQGLDCVEPVIISVDSSTPKSL
jgi:ERCC4-type nuclease